MGKKTHKVLDLFDTNFGGNTFGVYCGTFEDCQNFIAEQNKHSVICGYEIHPMSKVEIEIENS